MTIQIATACWFSKLDPAIYARIGISRGVPRGQAGFRRYPKLNPGSWFKSVTPTEYKERYWREVLNPLDPQTVVNELIELSEGKVPALLCWEKSNTSSSEWCHRGFVAGWLSDTLGIDVREIGHEHLGCGWHHPKIPPPFRVREDVRVNRFDDLVAFIGARFTRGDQTFEVMGLDPKETDCAILAIVGSEPPETMTVSVDLVLQHLGAPPKAKMTPAPQKAKKAGKGKGKGKGKIVGQQTLL